MFFYLKARKIMKEVRTTDSIPDYSVGALKFTGQKEMDKMLSPEAFGRKLKELRLQNGLTHQQLAEQMFVSQSTISRWERGERMPDLSMLEQLAPCLNTDLATLLDELAQPEGQPVVILVEDESIILKGCLRTLADTLPQAKIAGFQKADKALEFARSQRIDVAFLDIELSGDNGIELAQELRKINSCINIIFLTSHMDYMNDAWKLHASGFVMKPLDPEKIRQEMAALRYPVRSLMP